MKLFKIGFLENVGEEFAKELSVLSKLKHKNIVDFRGFLILIYFFHFLFKI